MIKVEEKNKSESYITFIGDDFEEYSRYISMLDSVAKVKYFDEKRLVWVCDTESAEKIKLLLSYPDPGTILKLKPYPYQKQAIMAALRIPGMLIQLPCGAGKSAIGIGIFMELLKQNVIQPPGIFIVKAALKNQWIDEIQKFSDLKPHALHTYKALTTKFDGKIKRRKKKLECLISDGAMKHAQEIIDLKAEIGKIEKDEKDAFNSNFDSKKFDAFIINYETLRDTAVKDALKKVDPQFFYVDEIDCIKDHTTLRAKALCEFKTAKYKYGATATPIRKNPKDLYGIFKFLNPEIFPSERDFNERYLKFYYGRISGSKNETELTQKIEPFRFKKSFDEIASQLPQQVVIQKNCYFTTKQEEVNERLLQEIESFKEQEKEIYARYPLDVVPTLPAFITLENNIAARQTFAQMMADSEELLEESDSNLAKTYITHSSSDKVAVAVDLMSKIIQSGEKVCVFSRFLKIQDILERELLKELSGSEDLQDLKIAKITGSVSSEERNDIIKRYNQDPEYKVLLLSDSGEAGLNLSTTKYMIEFELAESAAKQTQRHGRIQRADSIHKNVFVYQLITKNSWDEIAQKIVTKKEKYARDIL